MPISEKVIVNFHSSAPVAAEVANNIDAVIVGTNVADLVDINNVATGVSLSCAIAAGNRTAQWAGTGRAVGADQTIAELNAEGQSLAVSAEGAPFVWVLQLPPSHGNVDIDMGCCTTYGGQVDMHFAANGVILNVASGVGTNNVTGQMFTLSNVAPDGSDQIVITLDNNGPVADFAYLNGIIIHPVSAPTGNSATDTLLDGADNPIASQTLDFFMTETWGGAATDSGTLTTNASGVFTLSGLTAAVGNNWLHIKNQADANIVSSFIVTVT